MQSGQIMFPGLIGYVEIKHQQNTIIYTCISEHPLIFRREGGMEGICLNLLEKRQDGNVLGFKLLNIGKKSWRKNVAQKKAGSKVISMPPQKSNACSPNCSTICLNSLLFRMFRMYIPSQSPLKPYIRKYTQSDTMYTL